MMAAALVMQAMLLGHGGVEQCGRGGAGNGAGAYGYAGVTRAQRSTVVRLGHGREAEAWRLGRVVAMLVREWG